MPELPRLEATLEGIPDTIFQGEMVRGRLRVTNRGLAPAAHVFAKTAPPSWVFLGRDPGGGVAGAGDGGAACMSMVGVSGTVFQILPSSPPQGTGTGQGGSLAPGGSLTVPVWVRGLGGGKQTLRLLIRYQRAGGPSATAAAATRGMGGDYQHQQQQQYRYARVGVDVCVLPSVAVAPSVSPSYARPGECVLSLSVTNYRADGEAQRRRVDLHSVRAVLCWAFVCARPLGGFMWGKSASDLVIIPPPSPKQNRSRP